MVNATISSFSPLAWWPMQKSDGSLRMRIYYQKLNQVMMPITSDIPNVVSLLEEINMASDTSDLTNAFSPFLC